MKLSGTIGVTQKTMTFDTHVCLILLQTLNPQERWGTHKTRWPCQPHRFADVIGLVRCSYICKVGSWDATLSQLTEISEQCHLSWPVSACSNSAAAPLIWRDWDPDRGRKGCLISPLQIACRRPSLWRVPSQRKSGHHSIGPKGQVRSPFFCRRVSWIQSVGQSHEKVASVYKKRLARNQITSCTFTRKYWRTFMNHPGIWFPSQQHWSVPRHVTLWQKMLVIFPVAFPLTVLTTSEEYSGSLEAAMSENRPTSSSVKWEVLLSLCVILFWMQCAGPSKLRVASVVWERLDWKHITSCTFTSRYWRTFMNHPGIWFPSQQHWSVPRHVTLWQKMLVIFPVAFPLTVLTTSEEYSGSLEFSHVREPPNFFKCEVRSAPFLVCNPSLNAMCRAQQIAGCKCRVGKAWLKTYHKLHLYKQVLANIHESPWHMIPIPAALVSPKTCDTVAEDACNISSRFSIDRTHDKWGILRQSWIQPCQRTAQLLQVWSEKCSFPCV